MGVVELEAAFAMNGLPDYYFQAVGSGTGAIAAWEAFGRLIEDGRFGAKMPRIVIAQNRPFTPMVSAWQAGRAEIIADKDMKDAGAAMKKLYADVLSTRHPPYSIRGGVYDMLSSTNGKMYGITNDEAREAEKLFEGEEGVDLDPAASVAVAIAAVPCVVLYARHYRQVVAEKWVHETHPLIANAQKRFARWDMYGDRFGVYPNHRDGRGFQDLYEIQHPDGTTTQVGFISREMAEAVDPEHALNGYYFVDIIGDRHGLFEPGRQWAVCALPFPYGPGMGDIYTSPVFLLIRTGTVRLPSTIIP